MDPEKRLTIEAITTATAPSPKPVVESNSGDFSNSKEIVLRETTARFKEGKSQCEYGIHYEKIEDARNSRDFFLKEASILAYIEKKSAYEK